MHGTNVTALHTNVTALHYERPNNDNENTKFIKLFLQLDTLMAGLGIYRT